MKITEGPFGPPMPSSDHGAHAESRQKRAALPRPCVVFSGNQLSCGVYLAASAVGGWVASDAVRLHVGQSLRICDSDGIHTDVRVERILDPFCAAVRVVAEAKAAQR